MAKILLHPYTFIAALVLLGIVLGVSCWPRVQPAATVTLTATPPLPSPTVYQFPTMTPVPDVFTVPTPTPD